MVWSLSILLAAFQTDGVMRVFAEMKCVFAINVVRLVLLFLMMGWFLAKFQLIGAVLVTLIGMALAKILMLVRIRKLLEATYKEVLPWKHLGGTLLAAMAAALPAAFLNARLELPPLVILPLSGMVYMVTYTLLILIFGLLSEGEKTAIKRSLYVWNRGPVEPGSQASI
jgi:hypothetical protein